MEYVHVVISRIINTLLLLIGRWPLRLRIGFQSLDLLGLIPKLTGRKKLEKLNGSPEIPIGLLLNIVDLKLVDGDISPISHLLVDYLVEHFVYLFLRGLINLNLLYDPLLTEILVQSWRQKFAKKLFSLFVRIAKGKNKQRGLHAAGFID
jgi:hypothetical protein